MFRVTSHGVVTRKVLRCYCFPLRAKNFHNTRLPPSCPRPESGLRIWSQHFLSLSCFHFHVRLLFFLSPFFSHSLIHVCSITPLYRHSALVNIFGHLTCHGCDKPHQCWIMFANNRYLLCCRPGAMHHAQRRLALGLSCIESPSLSPSKSNFFLPPACVIYGCSSLSRAGNVTSCVFSSYSLTGGVGPAWDFTSLT